MKRKSFSLIEVTISLSLIFISLTLLFQLLKQTIKGYHRLEKNESIARDCDTLHLILQQKMIGILGFQLKKNEDNELLVLWTQQKKDQKETFSLLYQPSLSKLLFNRHIQEQIQTMHCFSCQEFEITCLHPTDQKLNHNSWKHCQTPQHLIFRINGELYPVMTTLDSIVIHYSNEEAS